MPINGHFVTDYKLAICLYMGIHHTCLQGDFWVNLLIV
jgi:hypothetical protein